jgi:4,5-dihydroxyphthalate decarboxylase
VPEYQMSAVMWFRGYLKDEFGIETKDINWVQAGLENPGRRDKFPLNLPEGFPLTSRNDVSLSQMLADGELDGVMSARTPSCYTKGHPQVRRLFPDYRDAERDYYKKTGIYPIMHALGIRRDIYDKNRWLAASLFKAYLQAKRLADAEFVETTALKIGLPWITAEYESTVAALGPDFWSYGVEPNRKTLATMARYSYEQGLSVREVAVDEMFAEGNLSETRV